MFSPSLRLEATCDMGCAFEPSFYASPIEQLEDRKLMSHTVGHVDTPTIDAAPALNLPLNKGSKHARESIANGVIPISITGLTVVGNQLMAQGLLGNQPFSVPITVTAEDNPDDPTCPILNLELGPIHLDLLGLVVDTSEICLRIEGTPGEGQLLGNLLCSVAGLLDGGLNLGSILDGVTGAAGDVLTQANVDTVLTGLTGILNGALGAITAPTAIQGVSSSANGVTDILNLAVGPLDLNLLGLDVELDDCDGGPVTVDITAESGPGNLLGNLLGGLAGALDGPANSVSLLNRIGRIAREIARLLS